MDATAGPEHDDEWKIEPARSAERFQLFLIIALGESIVAAGATASSLVLDLPIGTSLMVAFASSAALWWLYSDEVAWRARRFLSRSDEKAARPRRLHLPAHPDHRRHHRRAVGDEIVSRTPSDSLGRRAAVILGGPVLYLIGHTLFDCA